MAFDKIKIDSTGENSALNLHAWQNLTEGVAISKSYGNVGQSIFFNDALRDPAYHKDLFSVNSGIDLTQKQYIGAVNLPVTTSSQLKLDPYHNPVDATPWNRITVADIFATTGLYGINASQPLAARLSQSQILFGAGIIPTLQNSPLFGAVDGSIINNSLVFGGKSAQELEKEERESAIQRLEEKYKEEIRKNREESNKVNEKLQANLQKLAVQYETLLVSINGSQKKRAQGIRSDMLKKGNVSLNKRSGRVWVFKESIGILEALSADYWLFYILLVDSFEIAVDYQSLMKEIYHRAGKKNPERQQSKTAQNYCQSTKSNINSYAPKIAELISVSKTLEGKRGYRIVNPEPQKVTRIMSEKN